MKRYRTALPLAFIVASAAAATATGCNVESADRHEAEIRGRETGWRGIVLESAPPKPSFTLEDTNGEPFDFRKETDGYSTFLFFGYTSCPDVCPVHMASLAAVRRQLPSELQRSMKVVFVTTDPERDTPERIREWLANFDPDFIGLRGSKAEVDSIQLSLGLPPSIYEPPDETGFYVVGHASQVLAFSPDGSIRVIYPFGTRQADWKHDIPKLAAAVGD
ncbi:MAG: SCO family protein [Gemmatimonadota bacterium]